MTHAAIDSFEVFDAVVVGAGIVGLATAMVLAERHGRSVIVLEKEGGIASHQTGHNSGVIHSGLYYKPGSEKARTCTKGREALVRFCERKGIRYERCGKIVVATTPEQVAQLDELERRGRANGLTQLRRLEPDAIREVEPYARGLAALWVGETGIVSYREVAQAYADELRAFGGDVRTGARVLGVARDGFHHAIETTAGVVRGRVLVNCAGLESDRVAQLAGIDPGVRIVPFRGEYYELVPERTGLVKHLIYPVPNPAFPFLGVHFTRRITGGVEAGPNAVLALKREGYTKISFSARDVWSTLSYGGFWRMAAKYWLEGWYELYRSWEKRAFVEALQELVPDVREGDLRPAGAGVRAQALDPRGRLVDDFVVREAPAMIHVLNAPSPAATASLAIAETIAERVVAHLV